MIGRLKEFQEAVLEMGGLCAGERVRSVGLLDGAIAASCHHHVHQLGVGLHGYSLLVHYGFLFDQSGLGLRGFGDGDGYCGLY